MRPIFFLVTAVFWLAATASFASAQSGTGMDKSSQPITGSSGIRPPVDTTPTFGASSGTEILRHRDFAGKACLDVGGFARAHTIDTNLYDHVITVRNNCPLRIALQVCYYRTRDCIPIEIPGGARKEAILGTLPSTRDFRFEFREKF
jgi:hypothetical protein